MTRITLRLPDDLHEAVAALAQQEDRSLNQMIVRAIRREIERATWDQTGGTRLVSRAIHADGTQTLVEDHDLGGRTVRIKYRAGKQEGGR